MPGRNESLRSIPVSCTGPRRLCFRLRLLRMRQRRPQQRQLHNPILSAMHVTVPHTITSTASEIKAPIPSVKSDVLPALAVETPLSGVGGGDTNRGSISSSTSPMPVTPRERPCGTLSPPASSSLLIVFTRVASIVDPSPSVLPPVTPVPPAPGPPVEPEVAAALLALCSAVARACMRSTSARTGDDKCTPTSVDAAKRRRSKRRVVVTDVSRMLWMRTRRSSAPNTVATATRNARRATNPKEPGS